jgi:hypothetical protein
MEEKIKEFLRKEGVILPKDLVGELFSQVLKFAGGFSGLVFAGAKKAGEKMGELFKNHLQVKEEEFPNLIKLFFKETGMAEIEVEKSEEGYKINIIDSFLLKTHNKPDIALKPIAGALEGFAEKTLNRDFEVIQKEKIIILKTFKKGG